MPTLGKTIFELGRIFRLLNHKYYSGMLETPIIAIQTKGKQNAYGWCTTRKIWREQTENGSEFYEITMTAEHLTRSNADIVTTLLHEMAHLHNLQFGIKDTSRSGTYHNERFKKVAEAHGLIIEYMEKHGWTLSSLNPDAQEYLAEIKVNRQAFKVARQAAVVREKGKTKSSTRKYECPMCGMSVRATKAVKIICAECMVLMRGPDESELFDDGEIEQAG
jgi:hypothetical protein